MLNRKSLFVPLLLLALLSPIAAQQHPEIHKPKGFVNDFANVIPAKTRQRLATICNEVDQKAHAQIAVVTIDSTAGVPIADYARTLFNQWGIGPKGQDRGILILLAIKDRQSRIDVGRGFETLFPNERAAKIIAEMTPDLRQQRYSVALCRSVHEIASIIANDRGVTLNTLVPAPRHERGERPSWILKDRMITEKITEKMVVAQFEIFILVIPKIRRSSAGRGTWRGPADSVL